MNLLERLRGDKWMPSKTLNIEAANMIEQLQRELIESLHAQDISKRKNHK